MSYVQAIVLALVQAVTEFLPISSSGHLILLPRLLGWSDQGLAFDVATNTGTLLAVVAYFFADLKQTALGALRGGVGPDGLPARRLAFQLAVGTIPAAIVGLLARDAIATIGRDARWVAGNLLLFGIALALADRFGRKDRDLAALGWFDVLAIGCAQALALSPGTSRSGVTITAALLLGFARPAAARFSFLLSVPVGLLAAGHEIVAVAHGGAPWPGPGPTLVGIAVSAVAGYAVIGWLLGWLKRHSLQVFAVYRIALAVGILLFAAG